MASVTPENERILLVEPDAELRARVSGILFEAGYRVTTVGRTADALEVVHRQQQDAILLSLELHTDGQPGAIPALKERAPTTPLLVLADPSRIRDAVRAMRAGAEDYLLRPPDPFELRIRLKRILEHHELDSRNAFFQDQLSKKGGIKEEEARSPAMRGALERVGRVAPMRSTVLINGESGVGKELVARLIHFSSPRREQPFVALNCAAMPASLIESELFGHERGAFTGAYSRSRGKFEIAHRGTLFLDEIGEMAAATQAKLLRVLEQKEFMRVGGEQSVHVDVRLIAATNAELETLVARSAFRRDLYYRLKVVTITVPPLRERGPDIPSLVERFLDELSRVNGVPRKSFAPEALDALLAYHWPGNVRELKNLIESALVSVPGALIGVEDLPSSIRGGAADAAVGSLAPGTTLEEMERELIRRTLERTGGNRTHSAALLGIGIRTLQRKIHAFGIKIPPRRRRRRQPLA